VNRGPFDTPSPGQSPLTTNGTGGLILRGNHVSSSAKSLRYGSGAWILAWLLSILLDGGVSDFSFAASPPKAPKAAKPASKALAMTPIPKVRDERSAQHQVSVFEDNQHHQIQLLTEQDTRSSVSLSSDSLLLAKAEPTWQVLWSDGVFEADFNRDGNTDFLVVFGSPANGLVRDTRQLVFFLSDRSGKAYRSRIVYSSAWNTNAFLLKDRNGPCQYRHTGLLDLMEAGFKPPSEPKAQSLRELQTYFWVYQILEFRDTRLVAIPGKGYPRFVEFNKFGESSGIPHHFSVHRKEMLAQDLLRQMIRD
jgi:hypothetical protein